MKEYTDHLLEIAKCPNFLNCEGTPCEKIVKFQDKDHRQLPEPWSGDLSKGKILFISSNPSIDFKEYFPTVQWNDESIIDFFQNRFETNKHYVKNYLYPKQLEGFAPQWVRYWGFIRSISKQLLDNKNVIPGKDYALLEIVRCKSHRESGVIEALDTCAEKYLEKTLILSNAKVFVAVGDKSRDILQNKLGINLMNNSYTTKNINEINRIIFATPHSNARKKRTLNAILNQEVIDRIKEEIKNAR